MAEKKKPVAGSFTVDVTFRRDKAAAPVGIPTGVALEKVIRNAVYDSTGFQDDEIHVSVRRTDK